MEAMGGREEAVGSTEPITWQRAIRSRGGSFFLVVWLPLFLLTQYVAFGLATYRHPAGLDDCEAAPPPDFYTQAAVIMGLATAGIAVVALWRLRGGWRLLAMVPVALAALLWLAVLGGSQSC